MPAVSQKSKVLLVVYVATANKDRDIRINHLSFEQQNNKPVKKIIADMTRRLLQDKYHNFYKKAIFYENSSSYNKKVIDFINNWNDQYIFEPETAKVKMLVYIPNKVKKYGRDIPVMFYSPNELNNLTDDEIINFMEEVYLKGIYKNMYKVATFYENTKKNKDGKVVQAKNKTAKEILKIFGTN